MSKNKKQTLYATQTYSTLNNYKTAKAFFKDVKSEYNKTFANEKGIKNQITRTQKLLKQAIEFKGSRKDKKQLQQKFIKSFLRLANKEYLYFNKQSNTLKKRFVVNREFYDGKFWFSRRVKIRTNINKSRYQFSGQVYDYQTFKERFNQFPLSEQQKIYNYQHEFIAGRYSRWTTSVKSILEIDMSVSDVMLNRWIDDYKKGK